LTLGGFFGAGLRNGVRQTGGNQATIRRGRRISQLAKSLHSGRTSQADSVVSRYLPLALGQRFRLGHPEKQNARARSKLAKLQWSFVA